jgi:hypothetical protein
MRAANFEIVSAEDGNLTIRDLGPWSKHPTVTNDAEAVVKRLVRHGILKAGMRLFYYDSEGRLDEILHDGEKFTGFAPGLR